MSTVGLRRARPSEPRLEPPFLKHQGEYDVRLQPPDLTKLTPEQQRIFDEIAGGKRGGVRGPLLVLLNSPALADKAQALGAFCRYDTSLPPRLSELAILTIAAHWRAGYEWYAHAPIGLKAGLDPMAVEAIRTGRTPEFQAADEKAVYEFTHELLTKRRVSQDVYDRADAALGGVSVLDLIGVIGYYQMVATLIVTFEVPIPDGPEPFG
jgi:4-carboxymuconolactone decarboxylase